MLSTDYLKLLDFLQHSEPTPAAKGSPLKGTFQEFVMEHGWWYEPVVLSKKIALGRPNESHKNALELMRTDNSLIYCEGYALFESGNLPTIHAWVTDGRGRAIDNTRMPPGVAYAGVPFKTSFVSVTTLTNQAMVTFLQILRGQPSTGFVSAFTAGDPDEWLEPKGPGVRRIRKKT